MPGACGWCRATATRVPATGRGTARVMTEPTDAPQPPEQQPADDAREPADSAQRRLVETVAAFEVDPPAPTRAREEEPGA